MFTPLLASFVLLNTVMQKQGRVMVIDGMHILLILGLFGFMGQHVVKYVNLTLLILYPISWFSPLMSAGLLPLFGMSEITIISGILTLWQDDPFLSLIVVLFAVLLPMGKTLCVRPRLTPGWPPNHGRMPWPRCHALPWRMCF